MAAPTAKKRTPRKATATRPAPAPEELSNAELDKLAAELETDDGPIGPDGEIRPVQVGKRGRVGTDQVHIFTLDDVKYFIPASPGPAVTMKFQRNLRRIGRDAAVMEALLDLLGDRALDALAASPSTQPEDIADVILVVGKVLFDAIRKLREASDPS